MSQVKVAKSQFSKISHLRADVAGERLVPLLPLFDGQEWHQWFPTGRGELTRYPEAIYLVKGRYFGKMPARATDCIIDLLQFITKYATFVDVAPIALAIEHDVLNLGAALWKVDLQFELATKKGVGGPETVVTDLEYILVTCRSLIDLIQQTLRALWQRVSLSPECGFRHKASLPSSMVDVVAKGDATTKGRSRLVKTPEEIRDKYHLPDRLVEFYERSAPFLLALRNARDAIVHRPTESSIIFRSENGFAVQVDESPFQDLGCWEGADLAPNALGSLRTVLAQVVLNSLRIGEDMVDTLSCSLKLPDDIAPGLHVFLRSDYIEVLQQLEAIAAGGWGKFAEIEI